MNIILTGIFIILLLDFFIKYNKIIKKIFKKTKKKVVKKSDTFMIKKKGVGDKIIDELSKEL